MTRFQPLKMLPLSGIGLIFTAALALPSQAGPADIGGKGANVYCFMRSSGNSHAVSWDAAYQIIKRQKSSLFKTSPKHAAVMITETVVQNPEKYSKCGSYLGDIFSPADITNLEVVETEVPGEENTIPQKVKKGDRYSY